MEVGACRVRSRNGEVLPLWAAGRLRLRAEVGWIVEGPDAVLAAVDAKLPAGVCERLAAGLLVLSFGNAVGLYDAGPLGRLDVHTGKWGADDYDRLLERIADEASALPFAAGTPSALPFERAALGAKDVLYHAFVYLRHVTGPTVSRGHALRPALEGVLRDPHRRLQRETRVVPVDRARRVDARTLQDVVSGRWPMSRAPRGSGPLAEALGGRLPLELEEGIARDTLDTAENRFVKAFLDTCLWVAERMRGRAESARKQLKASILAGCAAIERALAPIRQHSLWRVVGPMVQFPASSTVLHRRPAYRTIFQTYNRLRLGAQLPLSDERSTALLEVKDIALLYEMWCCFAMIKAVSNTAGRPKSVGRFKRDDLAAKVPWEYRAKWGDGTLLTYNPSFSRSRSPGRRSYSVALRPDVGLHVPGGRPNSGLHLFDAKFKVDWLQSALADSEDQEVQEIVEAEERKGVFKRADLYKMHAYRDAIPKARSAWVLYPGTEERFFADGSALGTRSGVGALPLGADGELEVVTRVVGELLQKTLPKAPPPSVADV